MSNPPPPPRYWQPGPPPPPVPPPTGPPARSRSGPLLLGLVIGAVAVVIVAAILAATGVLHLGRQSSSAATVDTRAISLPATLGGFTDVVEATTAKTTRTAVVNGQRDNQSAVRTATIAAYQQAYGGAAVDYRAYSDADLQHQVSVIAVRADSAGLTIGPVQNPAYLGLAVAPREVKSFGPVSCEIVWGQTYVTGKTPDPEQQITSTCQQTGNGVTVITTGGGFRGAADQSKLVATTTAAWTAVQNGS